MISKYLTQNPMRSIRLKILLLRSREKTSKILEAWRGNIEQIDDVLIIGRKF
jgi:hypothetical protein